MYLFILLITMVAVAWPLSGQLSAQDTDQDPTETVEATEVALTVIPTATPTAYRLGALKFNLLAQVDLSLTTIGPVEVSAATVTLPAEVNTVTFVTTGNTVISAYVGTITVEADQAILGVTDIAGSIGLHPLSGTPGPVDAVTITTTQQVYLAPGATVALRNDSTAPATLLILTVVSQTAGGP